MDHFALANSADDLDARLAQLPRPWETWEHRLTSEEYEGTLRHWAKQHPEFITLQRRGESRDGLGVYLLRITDAGIADDDKQVALVTALHGGPERTGSSTALRLVEWLLGDSPLALETRRRQIVLILPIPNPHAFFVTDRWGNVDGVEIYDPPLKWWNLKDPTKIRLTDPAKSPELAAVVSVVDEYQPEVHLDLHGTGLQAYPESMLGERRMHNGRARFEVSACSYSNCCVRPWDPRVTEAMVRAGQEAGYGSDRAEADAQRIFWSADNDPMRDRLWIPPRPGRFRTPFYGYMMYHTMISTTEIAWEDSGVARVAGVLALGNSRWMDECVPGYPVDRVKPRGARFITAYGKTAAQRRASRVELWQAQGGFVDGILYPEYEGRTTYVCAVTEAGSTLLSEDPAGLVENLRRIPSINADAIGKFTKAGPEIEWTVNTDRKAAGVRIRNGIGFRFRIPYRSPRLLDVSVNGHSLSESSTDGYQAWQGDGYTQVQINVPPEKAREADIFVVTCAYDPNEERRHGFTPPPEVLRQLREGK